MVTEPDDPVLAGLPAGEATPLHAFNPNAQKMTLNKEYLNRLFQFPAMAVSARLIRYVIGTWYQ